MKKIVSALLFTIVTICALVPLAYAVNIIKLDQSQLNNVLPNAVTSGYGVVCNASGFPSGLYLKASIARLTYASGVPVTLIESDAVSGVVGSHLFTTTYTYTGGSLTSTSCPTLTTSF